MRHANTNPCPFCTGNVIESESQCSHCGRYTVVPDGTKFGISLLGEIKLHGMDLEKARTTVNILNEVMDLPRAC